MPLGSPAHTHTAQGPTSDASRSRSHYYTIYGATSKRKTRNDVLYIKIPAQHAADCFPCPVSAVIELEGYELSPATADLDILSSVTRGNVTRNSPSSDQDPLQSSMLEENFAIHSHHASRILTKSFFRLHRRASIRTYLPI